MIAAILDLQESTGIARKALHQMACGFTHGHDVIDAQLLARKLIMLGIKLLGIAQNQIHFCHRGKVRTLRLRRTACHDNARLRLFALHPPNGLARLAHGFVGNSASVEHHRMLKLRFTQPFTDQF